MAVHAFTVANAGTKNACVIYGEKANLNYFLKTPLEPDVIAGVTNEQVGRAGSTRRQYPGDPTPVTVSGSTAEYLRDPSRKSGAALPGRSIRLVGDPGMPGEESRIFTLKGRWVDFHAWLRANAKMLIYAYNSSGARYTIPAAGTTPSGNANP